MVKQSGGTVIMEESQWKSHGGIVTVDHSFSINGGKVMLEQSLWNSHRGKVLVEQSKSKSHGGTVM